MVDLKLENISKSYGQIKVIDNVSCQVEDGELMVLVGPSGCGKTTLLKIINVSCQVEDVELMVAS
jgi:ABC-type sugar transport system ATPase subunit